MGSDELNWMQRYAASEVVEHAAEGTISRRVMLTRLVAIGGSATAATALLAACDGGGSDSSSGTSRSSASSRPSTTGSTSVTPATGSVAGGAALSIAADDPDVKAENVTFPGPAGQVLGYSAVPTAPGKRAGVIVIHEIFGLTDHIRDVARRVAKAGYLALAVDLASRAGGSDNTENVMGALTQGPVEDRVADLDAGYDYLEAEPRLRRQPRRRRLLLRRRHDALVRGRPARREGRGPVLRPDPAAAVGDGGHERGDPRPLRRDGRPGERRASPTSRPRWRARRSRRRSTPASGTRSTTTPAAPTTSRPRSRPGARRWAGSGGTWPPDAGVSRGPDRGMSEAECCGAGSRSSSGAGLERPGPQGQERER